MIRTGRRQFLAQCAALSATTWLWPESVLGGVAGPMLHFPASPRDRIAVASYPFREFIRGASRDGSNEKSAQPQMELKDFAAHVRFKFNINKIEPWSEHFLSTEVAYLEQIRAAVDKASGFIVNIAVDGESSPYAADRSEREEAVAFSKHWVDIAVAVGAPGIRTNIPPAKDSKPNLKRTVESLLRVVEYASTKNIVVSLENDNSISEEPFFLVKVVEKVNSPWLHTLPDFANTLAAYDPKHAYEGIDAMFGKAYSICHVKAAELNAKGKLVHVDMAKTFGFMKQHDYRGFCSMEFDSPGDPYKGTSELIEQTLHYLS